MTERIWDRYLSPEDKAVCAAAGYGTPGGGGARPAILVVDVNYNFTGERDEPILTSIATWPNSCGEYAWRAIPHLQQLIAAGRRKGLPIIYTTGGARADGWDAGSWLWKNRRAKEPRRNSSRGNEIVGKIAPLPQDIVIRKLKPSAFHGTPLKALLTLLKVDTLIVGGTTTSGCVRATVLDAFAENIRVLVVEEGCFDRAQVSHAVNLFDMNAKYADVIPIASALTYIDGLEERLFVLPAGVP